MRKIIETYVVETIIPKTTPQDNYYKRTNIYFEIDDIYKIARKHWNVKGKAFVSINGFVVRINSERLKDMLRNILNLNNNIEPLYFSLEKQFKDGTNPSDINHLNLYGWKKDDFLMITRSDIDYSFKHI